MAQFANAGTNRCLRIAIATLLTRLREDNPQTRFDTHRNLWIVDGHLVYYRDCELRGGDLQWRFEIKRCELLCIAIANHRYESTLQWRFAMRFTVAICNVNSHRCLRIAMHRRLGRLRSLRRMQSQLRTQSKVIATTKAIVIAFAVLTAKAIAIASCDASYDIISDISTTFFLLKFKLMPLSLKLKGTAVLTPTTAAT